MPFIKFTITSDLHGYRHSICLPQISHKKISNIMLCMLQYNLLNSFLQEWKIAETHADGQVTFVLPRHVW